MTARSFGNERNAPTKAMETHLSNIETLPFPTEVDAGVDITLKVKVSCPAGCNLTDHPVQVVAPGDVIITSKSIKESGDLIIKAPEHVGTHAWTIRFPRCELDGVIHEESCLAVSFTTRPHETSMAVWDVPSPVVMSQSFKAKVGVKCSLGCRLSGQLVEVFDDSEIRIGTASLSETAWPGTTALYVANVELTAPVIEGIFVWSARFPAHGPGLPHEVDSAAFSFRTARPPGHRVTVKVTDRDTQAPLESVDVMLGAYRASTNAQGLASLELPGGVYNLDAWKTGYETLPRTIEVAKDLSIQIEASLAPEKDPDDQRVWM